MRPRRPRRPRLRRHRRLLRRRKLRRRLLPLLRRRRPRLLRLLRSKRVLLALALALALAAASACEPRAAPDAPAALGAPRIAIVVAEGDARGVRLVAIDEHGDRQLELLQPAQTVARDTNPAVSPDGQWMVFASSRGRPLDETSLWIAKLAPDAVPVPLTTGRWIDAHPAWTPDGSALVWASTRGGHGFDLWRASFVREPRPALAEPQPLTSAAGHEITPVVARDGAILYAAVTDHGGGTMESHLEELAPSGAIRTISDAATDSAPALSPDGTRVVFARPIARAQGLIDSDLWIVPRAGGEARSLVELPLTDESGPVWSRDGRYVLATSVLRGADGRAVFSSVIVIDTHEPRPVARLLEDRAGAIARLTPAIAAPVLDDIALHADPEYLPELAHIVAKSMAEAKSRGRDAGPPPDP